MADRLRNVYVMGNLFGREAHWRSLWFDRGISLVYSVFCEYTSHGVKEKLRCIASPTMKLTYTRVWSNKYAQTSNAKIRIMRKLIGYTR